VERRRTRRALALRVDPRAHETWARRMTRSARNTKRRLRRLQTEFRAAGLGVGAKPLVIEDLDYSAL